METTKNDATLKQNKPKEDNLNQPRENAESPQLSISQLSQDCLDQPQDKSKPDPGGHSQKSQSPKNHIKKDKLEQQIKEIQSSMKRIKSSKLIQSSSRTKKRITEDTIYRFTTAGKKKQAAKDYILSLQLSDKASDDGKELAKMELSEFINLSGKLQIELRIRNIVDVHRQSSEESKSQEDSVTEETEVKIEELSHQEETKIAQNRTRTIYLPKLLRQESSVNQSQAIKSVSQESEIDNINCKKEENAGAAEENSQTNKYPQVLNRQDNLEQSEEIKYISKRLNQSQKAERKLSENIQISLIYNQQKAQRQTEIKDARKDVAKEEIQLNISQQKEVSDHVQYKFAERTAQQVQHQQTGIKINAQAVPTQLNQHFLPILSNETEIYPLNSSNFRHCQSRVTPLDFFSMNSHSYPIYAFNRPQLHPFNTTQIPYTSPYQPIDETSSQQSSTVNSVIVIDSLDNIEPSLDQPTKEQSQSYQISERGQAQQNPTQTQTAVSVSNQQREGLESDSHQILSPRVEPIQNSKRKISIIENQCHKQQQENEPQFQQIANKLSAHVATQLQNKLNKKQTHSQASYNPNRVKVKRKASFSNEQAALQPENRPRKLRSQQTEQDRFIKRKKQEIVERLSYIKSTLPSFLEAFEKQHIASMQRAQANYIRHSNYKGVDPKVNEITSLCANLSMACEQSEPVAPSPSITAHMNGTSSIFQFQPNSNHPLTPAILFMKKRQEPQPTSLFQLKPRSSSIKKPQEELVEQKKKKRAIVRIHQ